MLITYPKYRRSHYLLHNRSILQNVQSVVYVSLSQLWKWFLCLCLWNYDCLLLIAYCWSHPWFNVYNSQFQSAEIQQLNQIDGIDSVLMNDIAAISYWECNWHLQTCCMIIGCQWDETWRRHGTSLLQNVFQSVE